MTTAITIILALLATVFTYLYVKKSEQHDSLESDIEDVLKSASKYQRSLEEELNAIKNIVDILTKNIPVASFKQINKGLKSLQIELVRSKDENGKPFNTFTAIFVNPDKTKGKKNSK